MTNTCKQRYGKRFIKLSKTNGRYHCRYQMNRKQAYARCAKSYGERLLRMTKKKNGRFTCWYRPSFEEAVAQCRANHGNKLIDVIRKDNDISAGLPLMPQQMTKTSAPQMIKEQIQGKAAALMTDLMSKVLIPETLAIRISSLTKTLPFLVLPIQLFCQPTKKISMRDFL